eukprot:282474_1
MAGGPGTTSSPKPGLRLKILVDSESAHSGFLEESPPIDAISVDVELVSGDGTTEGNFFRQGDLAIHSRGVLKDGDQKIFTLVYEDLEIGDIVGRGGSSVVVRAMHTGTGTILALKVISLFGKSKRDQLIREINTLYNAECDALIKFYGAFYREGAITIALEYMDGGSLSNVLHQMGPMPEWIHANMVYQILWGLAYLKHEHRVHRDIKPSNLLINSLGEVKVTDFGVSAELQSSIAMCGTFVGSFKYMSPERIRSEGYSYASDIWSLGLVILECVTGEYPLQEEETAIGMVQAIIEGDPPRADPTFYTPEFCHFIACCLQICPSDRYPAEQLLHHPWMTKYSVTNLKSARANVRRWIESAVPYSSMN